MSDHDVDELIQRAHEQMLELEAGDHYMDLGFRQPFAAASRALPEELELQELLELRAQLRRRIMAYTGFRNPFPMTDARSCHHLRGDIIKMLEWLFLYEDPGLANKCQADHFTYLPFVPLRNRSRKAGRR